MSRPITRLANDAEASNPPAPRHFMGLLASLAVLLAGLLAVSLTILRLTPFQPVPASGLLEPSSACAWPCILNLTPGETTLSDALLRLRANPWLLDATPAPELARSGTGFIFLTWNGKQPAYLNDRLVASVWVENGVVALVRLPLRVSLGDLALAFAPVEQMRRWRLSDTAVRVVITLAPGLNAYSTLTCPFRLPRAWRAPAELRVGDAGSADSLISDGHTVQDRC